MVASDWLEHFARTINTLYLENFALKIRVLSTFMDNKKECCDEAIITSFAYIKRQLQNNIP